MKPFNFIVLFVVLAVIVPIQSLSQQRLNKLSFSPIQLLGFNQLNLEYERGFKSSNIGISVYLSSTGNAFRKVHGQYSKLSEQNFSLKYYSNAIDSSSFWFGGILSVASGNIYDENGIDSAKNIGSLGIQFTTGYQFIFKSLYINPYLSAGYSITNDLFGSAEYTGNINKPSQWILTYGFKIGMCF